MRVMVIVKATKNSEAGVLPTEQLITEMGKSNAPCPEFPPSRASPWCRGRHRPAPYTRAPVWGRL